MNFKYWELTDGQAQRWEEPTCFSASTAASPLWPEWLQFMIVRLEWPGADLFSKASPELHWIHWCGSYRGRWPRAGWSLWLMLFIWQLVCLWSLKCPCSPSTVPADTTNTLGAVSVPFPLIRLHSAWIIPRFQWSGQQSLSYRQGPKWGPVKSKNWKEIDLEGKTDVIHLNSRRWCLGLKGPLWK